MGESHVTQVRLARVPRLTATVLDRGAGGATPTALSLEALRVRRALPPGSAGPMRALLPRSSSALSGTPTLLLSEVKGDTEASRCE